MAMKKKFIEIELTLLNEVITALGTAESLDKRTIKLDLSRKLRGRGLEATFLIRNEEETLKGYPKKLELMKSYIIRMMRKRANYVEDSFEANCKDIVCKIKPFLITRKKVSRAIRNNLRKTSKEFILDYIKEKTYIEVCTDILHGDLQREMLPKLKKVYPLSFCEIRIIETKSLDNADLTIKKETKIIEETEEEESNSEDEEIEKEEEE
jgi:ribosomal protein S3AE